MPAVNWTMEHIQGPVKTEYCKEYGMSHSSEVRWPEVSVLVSQAAEGTLRSLSEAEYTYQELLEVYTYSGGTDQLFADLLFKDVIEAESRTPPEANVEEVAMVTDFRLAITALHELNQAMNNFAITQDDRATKLRRMT